VGHSSLIAEQDYCGDFQKQAPLEFRFAMETDIGGGKTNEDDCFIWKHKETKSVVFGVIDGHGGSQGLGKFTSQQIRLDMVNWLEQNFSSIFRNPCLALRNLFSHTQQNLFFKFQDHLKKRGYDVRVHDGYVLRRKGVSSWACVSGGAVVSVVVLVHGGSKMYTANVGDCGGILSINGRLLSPEILTPLYPEDEMEELKINEPELHTLSDPTGLLHITWDHSPDCPREFRRMRNKRSDTKDPLLPFLNCVYEGLPSSTSGCTDIFSIDEKGRPTVTGNGQYHKNVRGEWATRVIPPSDCDIQEALSMTRALGDFPMQRCGVTYLPDVFEVDLLKGFGLPRTSSHETDSELEVGVIALCSDGVWDNWQYEDVVSFFMQSALVEGAFQSDSESAANQLKEFMQQNHENAAQNFGNKADNATGIVCYLFKSNKLESEDTPEAIHPLPCLK